MNLSFVVFDFCCFCWGGFECLGEVGVFSVVIVWVIFSGNERGFFSVIEVIAIKFFMRFILKVFEELLLFNRLILC